MTIKIRRAAVLGAGVMGAQIAAHLAAAGVRTYLLDLPSDEPPADKKLAKAVGKNIRSSRAIVAIENLKKLKPNPLSSPSILPNIIPGNFEDDWSVLAETDWVIEAVIERLDIKIDIHTRINEVVKPGTPVTTNTSGIPLRDICKDLPEHYQHAFFGTHFFNPPRYMHLLEIIPHGASDMKTVHALSNWCSERLGKGIVFASDTINFIANRIGVLSMQATLKHMSDLGLNIETADLLTGPLVGHPKSASLRTMDVVGLDTMAHVANNVVETCKEDPMYDYFVMPDWLMGLIKKGHIGQKSGNIGCYKKSRDEKGKTKILVYRPETEEYVDQAPADVPWMKEAKKIKDLYKRLEFIFAQDDNYAEFIWRIHRDVFSYCALLLEEIANGLPRPLDEAICWGFNWESGPFQLWQGVGFEAVTARMKKDDAKLPAWISDGLEFYKPSPASVAWQVTGPQSQLKAPAKKHDPIPAKNFELHLPKFQNKEDDRVLLSNSSASLVDIGDNVACLVFHSKMNTLNDEIIELMQASIALVNERYSGMVIGNEGDAFSAGAYLGSIVENIDKGNFDAIDQMIRAFQGTMQIIKYAPFPTVSTPHGLTLGGGCEVSLHTTDILLTNDTFAGLVEVGVGLLPAGGGTKELALRAYNQMRFTERGDPSSFIQKAFMLIGMGQVSNSGQDAIEMGLYPQTTKLSLSKDHQIIRAKQMILQQVAFGYAPPVPQSGISVLGDPGVQTINLMLYNMVEGRQISAYDAFVGERVAEVLCGGTIDAGTRVGEQHFLEWERHNFVELCKQGKTKDRIVHMLKTGKPLRN